MATVREHFDNDFPQDLKAHSDWTVKVANKGELFPMVARVHMNHTTNYRFVSFYSAVHAERQVQALAVGRAGAAHVRVAAAVRYLGRYYRRWGIPAAGLRVGAAMEPLDYLGEVHVESKHQRDGGRVGAVEFGCYAGFRAASAWGAKLPPAGVLSTGRGF